MLNRTDIDASRRTDAAVDPPELFAIDVFCEHPGGGNPLGVVFGADHWDAAAMQGFAAWIGLVETTFVLQPRTRGAEHAVRIFTPHREIPFAGHPLVGTAHALIERGLVVPRDGLLRLETLQGPVTLKSDEAHRIFVRMPIAHIHPIEACAHAHLDGLLSGVAPGLLGPALVESGRRWWVVELADEAAVRNWQPDHAAIARLAASTGTLGVCVFARSTSADYALVVRAFPAGAGIVEDPASGAANGAIAARLRAAEPQGALAHGYVVSQGRELGRDARLHIRMDSDAAIWVGGCSHTIGTGHLHWPVRAATTRAERDLATS
jgi:PhzF family phenazine biosynthesis protein